MLQFGLRAHDFGRLPAEALAEKIAAFAPSSVQLALAKALPDIPEFPGFLSPGFARHVRNAFAGHGIGIAVLGCYINPVHPDPEIRETHLKRFEEHLRFARDFGCAVVGTETGSLNPDCSYHPDTGSQGTFDAFCASVERLARTAERCGSIVGIEPVAGQHTVSSIEKTRELLERIDSPALGIIYDPVNLIPLTGLAENQWDFFGRAFDAFGDRIVAVHAKDFRFENGKKIGNLSAGTGDLEYLALFSLLQAKKPLIDILLEDTTPATAQAALDYLAKAAEEAASAKGAASASGAASARAFSLSNIPVLS